jgi:hypothetical protein
MILLTAAVLTVGALLFTLVIRAKDLPEPELVSASSHLEERKAAIYEALRDLQFEYRLGKLSDHDFQQTRQDLQRDLGLVLAQIDSVKQPAKAPSTPAPKKPLGATLCPQCGARFPQPLKFCGKCGKLMAVEGP